MNIYLQMAVVRMRDSGDKHGLQFQITIHGQNKLYTFQAARKEVRDMWIKEIGRLLQAQFSLMKGEGGREGGRGVTGMIGLVLRGTDMVLQSGTLDRSNYRGKAKPGEWTAMLTLIHWLCCTTLFSLYSEYL